MEKNSYLISDAAKKVNVEAHVLRYWEGELELPIRRNEMGHRYYTVHDVERFKEIKQLKEQGLQLKAIRLVLAEGNMKKFMEGEEIKQSMEITQSVLPEQTTQLHTVAKSGTGEDKVQRLQWLLGQMMKEALQENNEVLSQDIRATVVKEMDYQFRIIEEREEEKYQSRMIKEEEHYKKVDELLRKKRKPFFKK